jgi:hypothetical protein
MQDLRSKNLKNEGNHRMRIKSYMQLLVPVLLFAGVQVFAQGAAESRMPAASPASRNMMAAHADVVLISDRTFLMKSIREIAMDQSFESQAGCSSNLLAGAAKASFSGGRCPVVDCAAPPPGCFYQGPPDLGPNGCPINCGHLVCGPEL